MAELEPTETVAETPDPTETPTPSPKPTETVDFWKQKAREQEARAKANAEKAQEFDKFQEAQKTEAQRLADAAAQSKRDADEARAEATRFRVAATHGVGADYFDLLGSGDEETISGRAQRVAGLLSVAQENAQLKAELEALRAGKAPARIRPVADLKPGATPEAAATEGDVIYSSLFGTN